MVYESIMSCLASCAEAHPSCRSSTQADGRLTQSTAFLAGTGKV